MIIRSPLFAIRYSLLALRSPLSAICFFLACCPAWAAGPAGAGPGVTPVSSFMRPVLVSTNGAQAKTLLDITEGAGTNSVSAAGTLTNLAPVLGAGNKTLQATNPAAFKALLSLENVDNTSDANKPISTATQAALDAKQGTNATLNALSTNTITGTGTIPLSSVTDALSASKQDGHATLSNLVSTATVASGGAVVLTNSDTAAASLTVNGPASGTNDLIRANSGDTNRFKVTEAGALTLSSGWTANGNSRLNASQLWGGGTAGKSWILNEDNGLMLSSGQAVKWSGGDSSATSVDLALYRHAANTLRLGNGTNTQEFRADNTYTDASNWESGLFSWQKNAGSLTIGTDMLGTGAVRPVQFIMAGTNIAYVSTSGHLLWNTDNTYDIGANGANRPRSVYVANNLISGNVVAGSYIGWASMSLMYSDADGNIRLTENDSSGFGRLQFGGTTTNFPSLKRSGTGLQVRLADDSGDAPLSASAYTIVGTTNQVIFGGTNTAPVSSASPTKWISVQVTGEATVYRLPLYE